MSEGLLSIPQLAKQSGVEEQSVRRYLERFPAFFLGRQSGRITRYPADCVAILARIKGLYGEGLTREQIAQVLPQEFQMAVDAEPDILPNTPANMPANALAEALLRLSEDAVAVRQALERVEALERENKRLSDRLEALERQQVLPPGTEAPGAEHLGFWKLLWRKMNTPIGGYSSGS